MTKQAEVWCLLVGDSRCPAAGSILPSSKSNGERLREFSPEPRRSASFLIHNVNCSIFFVARSACLLPMLLMRSLDQLMRAQLDSKQHRYSHRLSDGAMECYGTAYIYVHKAQARAGGTKRAG